MEGRRWDKIEQFIIGSIPVYRVSITENTDSGGRRRKNKTKTRGSQKGKKQNDLENGIFTLKKCKILAFVNRKNNQGWNSWSRQKIA